MSTVWPLVPLGDLGEWGSGGTPLSSIPEYYGGDIPWLIIEDLNDGPVYRSSRTITQLGLKNSSAKLLEPGTLMIAMYGSIGKLGITTFPCATNQAIAFCKCKSQLVDTSFLFYKLLQERENLLRLANGVTQANISQTILKEHCIPLPPLAEQRRLAAILARGDRLRRLRRYALELSEQHIQSAYMNMFGEMSSKGWATEEVTNLISQERDSFRTGPFGSQLLHSEFSDTGYAAIVGIENVVNNHFTWNRPRYITKAKYEQLKRYTVRPGDVLITIMGTTGRCAIAPDTMPIAINTKHLCCITLDVSKILPVFLHASFLRSPAVLHQLGVSERGAIMPGLNMELIGGLKIPLPPLALQERFAAIARRHERLRAQQREALRQAEQLFATLLDRAFRGELGEGGEELRTENQEPRTENREPKAMPTLPASQPTAGLANGHRAPATSDTPRSTVDGLPSGRDALVSTVNGSSSDRAPLHQAALDLGDAAGGGGDYALLRELLAAQGALTNGDVQEALGVDAASAREWLRQLVADGLARVEGQRRGTRYVRVG